MNCSNPKCSIKFESTTANNIYCSAVCQQRHAQFKWRERSKKPCPQCGKKITGRANLCHGCNTGGDWRTKTIGELRTKRNYQVHSQVRDIARTIYYKLNPNPACLKCGYDLHIEVAHVIAIKDFPDDTLLTVVNHPDNLKGLCRNCHWEQENGHWVFN